MHDDKNIFNHEYILWIDYFDSVFEKSHGLLNALVYGCTQYVKEEWRNFVRNKRRNSLEEEINISSTLNEGSERNNGKNSLSGGGGL